MAKQTRHNGLVNKAALRKLIFDRVQAAHRGEQIDRIDQWTYDVLTHVARTAMLKILDRAIETHPSKYKTLSVGH